jgi:Protein of unknown function (DUF3086)
MRTDETTDETTDDRMPEPLLSTIAELEAKRDRIQAEIAESQDYLARLIQDSLADLDRRRQALQLAVDQLERRQARIQEEMQGTFAGSSQEIAIRVQSFKDYLVGSLEDLVLSAQKLDLGRVEPDVVPSGAPAIASDPTIDEVLEDPQFAKTVYEQQTEKIRSVIRMFRTEPDYYGPTWKLRRTFESVHADRINDWFFTQGGRGSLKSLGSRLQNILVASAGISILYSLYGDRLRPLILANSPERLGEWRRGLQDCLGLRREDFSNDRGIMLFESPEPMAVRAERIQEENKMPLIIIDETEELVNLTLLRFPLWLAFAPSGEGQKQQQPLVQPRY